MLEVKMNLDEMIELAQSSEANAHKAVIDHLRTKHAGILNHARRTVAQALESTANTVKPSR